MALYPAATKMLLPESRTQARIVPKQFVVHSIAAPWTNQRLYEFWRNSTNLESHFGVAYDGGVAQFVDTGVRADANASANGWALSVETASRIDSTDRWTPKQIDSLADLMVWAGKTHKIPFVLASNWRDPGFGYHSMHARWSVGGTACPGRARIPQFRDELWPEVLRRSRSAPPKPPAAPVPPPPKPPVEEPDMTPEELYNAVWRLDKMSPPHGKKTDENPVWAAESVLREAAYTRQSVEALAAKVDALARTGLTAEQADEIAALVTAKVLDGLSRRLES